MLSRVRESLVILAAVTRSPVLRRLLGGFALSSVSEWATWLALVVFAFDRGGAAEAGVIGFVLGLPSLVVAPAGGVLGDRWPRARVLLASYGLQAVMSVATALALASGSALAAYGFALLSAASAPLCRPALASLLPEVVETPDELTAANVASGIAEGVGALVGPLVAGVLLALGGSALVFLSGAAGMVVSAVALLPIALASHPIAIEPRVPAGTPEPTATIRSIRRELLAGLVTIARDRRLASVFLVLSASTALFGAVGVFTIVIAIDLLGFDDSVAGYLTAASGFGALLGSGASVALVGRSRLGRPLILAAVWFGLAVAVLAFVGSPLVIALILAAAAIGYAFTNVAAMTLIQRLAGDDVMTRVFGVAESTMVGSDAVGGLIVPLLIALFGPAGAIVVAGLSLPLVVLIAAPAFLRADRVETELLDEMRAVRAIPMFRPLAGRVLERLAADAVPVRVEAGDPIISAGEVGDRFYILLEGRAAIEIDGVVTGEVEPGGTFGEIALIHDMPRTATVRATAPTRLLAIEREPFLEALTGQPRSRALADQVARRRLARDGSPST
jgi:MFS family permease